MYKARFFLNIFLLMVLFFCHNQYAYSQKVDTTELISVSLHVVTEGTIQYPKEKRHGHFAMATITNKQDTAITFWIMTCSWPDINWITNSNSVYFGSRGCDSNFPTEIKLRPQQSINFFGMFTPSGKEGLSKKIKLGFVYFNSFNDISEASTNRNKLKNFKKYWSNQVELKDNLFTYQLD